MSKERRKDERFDANLFADMEMISSGEDLGRGVVVDVSISGLAIETQTTLPMNEEISCFIEFPLTIRARVVRLQNSGNVNRYGLRFEKQSFLDKLLFRKILKGKRKTRKIRE